jgi:serine/threonine protein kinase
MLSAKEFHHKYPVTLYKNKGSYAEIGFGDDFVIKKGNLRDVLTDLDVLCQFSHPNLIKMLNWTSYIVEDEDEECPVEIEIALVSGESVSFLTKDIELIASKFIPLLSEMYDNDLVHLDIKPDNIVMVDGEPTLIDFSLSTLMFQKKYQGIAYTEGYRCPSYNNTLQWKSPATEIFALGSTLSYLKGPSHPFAPDKTEIGDLIKKCKSDIFERPSLSELSKHPYLLEVETAKMQRVKLTLKKNLPERITHKEYYLMVNWIFRLAIFLGWRLRNVVTMICNMWRTWHLYKREKAHLFILSHLFLVDNALIGQYVIDVPTAIKLSGNAFDEEEFCEFLPTLIRELNGIITPYNSWDEVISTDEDPSWDKIVWIVQKEVCIYDPEPLQDICEFHVFSGISARDFWSQFNKEQSETKRIMWFATPNLFSLPPPEVKG